MKKGTLEMEILKPVQSMDVSVESPVDPKEFFIKRTGLYVSESFTQKIVAQATTVGAHMGTIESLDLVTDASDHQIELSLGNKNVFPESEAAALIAELISRQSKGEDGDLLTNGYANLFYTPTCVVYVFWHASGGEWRVRAWERDDCRWDAGYRVFSPQLALDL